MIWFVVFFFLFILFSLSLVRVGLSKSVPCPNCGKKIKMVTNSVKCPSCKVKFNKDNNGNYLPKN